MRKYIIAVLLRSDDYTRSVFYAGSINFPEMRVIILINEFIRTQICINGSRQANVFVPLL